MTELKAARIVLGLFALAGAGIMVWALITDLFAMLCLIGAVVAFFAFMWDAVVIVGENTRL